jgi:hypothetical protein
MRRGLRSFGWICRIVIPVSLLVTILEWTGWLSHLYLLIAPLTNLIGLPSQAALPIITGMLVNVYAAIAAMTALPFSIGQMTLMAIFILTCHNLIAEGIIQHKSGLNAFKATLIRFVAATVTVLIVSWFHRDTSLSVAVPTAASAASPLSTVLRNWAVNQVFFLLKILGIVTAVMIIMEFSERREWTKSFTRVSRPLMRILGLSEQGAALWATSSAFGLMYGGAVIIDQASKTVPDKEALERLHISIGINHSLIEDPLLFMALGLPPFWLWVPRLIMAVVAVQMYRVVRLLKRKLVH